MRRRTKDEGKTKKNEVKNRKEGEMEWNRES